MLGLNLNGDNSRLLFVGVRVVGKKEKKKKKVKKVGRKSNRSQKGSQKQGAQRKNMTV